MKKENILPGLFTITRMLLGWHLFYEGLVKVTHPDWTSAPYLANSRWIFSGIFNRMASSPDIMQVVDFMNAWGLTLTGMALLLGVFIRISCLGGSLLLLFYYLAYPPIPGFMFGVPNEGAYLVVNKTLIEMAVLAAMAFIPGNYMFGLDRLFNRWKEEKPRAPVPAVPSEGKPVNRRELLKDLISVPVIGAFAYAYYKKAKWESFEEKYLENAEVDGVSGSTLFQFQTTSLNKLKGKIPTGKIGNLELGRLILGGNLIGGWAHARDLIYVNSLVKAYNTDERVFNTFALAEKCGINAIITNPQLNRVINKYWREMKGKIRFISDCGYQNMDFLKGIDISISGGAHACYCQGEMSDRLVLENRFDVIEKGIEKIRKNGLPAGIGAHKLETIQRCVEKGIRPDFWVKTLHRHNYWSAMPGAAWNDNIFCNNPEEVVAYMNNLEEPWIAFKVLAAGAINPEEAFPYSFNSGADFICVGMYDFQIVDDVNLTLSALEKTVRQRPWRA